VTASEAARWTRVLPDHLSTSSGPTVDATSLLSLYVVLLIAIPSKLIFASLGGAGTPAQIVGVVAALWYSWHRLQRAREIETGPQPVRAAILLFAAAVLASYVAAMVRPIADSEISTADMGLISLIGWVGVVVVANDGIISLDRLYVLLRRLAAMGGALATLGIAQFVSGQLLVDKIQIPGLSASQTLSDVTARDGFNRPPGTAVHPIEFGVVLTMILPIALVCAMTMKNRAGVRRWYPVIAIAVAIPLSISRTAIIGTIICLSILLPTWSKAARRGTLAAVATLTAILFVAVPGFLGTFTGLFTGIGTDTSAASRTDAYAIAWDFIERSPIIGRGFSTFLPSYWILDNQYLGLIIEVGVVGLAAMLWLIASGVLAAARARAWTTDPVTRSAGQALAAAIVCGAVSTSLYDLLGFPMSAGLLFLVLGLSGALWRLTREQAASGRHHM
jgi:O-antigen ligase